MQNLGKTSMGLNTNVASLLCYLPVCCFNVVFSIIVIATEKANKVMRFHAFQAILLAAAYMIVYLFFFASYIALIALRSELLGSLVNFAIYLIVVIYIAVSVFCCVKAYRGENFKLPVIGDFAERWS